MLCIVVWYSSLNKYRFQWEDILFSRFFFKVRKNFLMIYFLVYGWWFGGMYTYHHHVEREVANQNIFTRLNIYGFPPDLFPALQKFEFYARWNWTSYNLAYFLLPRLWQILKLFHSTYSSSIKLIFLKSVSYYLKGMYVMQLHYWAKCVHCSHTAMLIFASFLMFV